MTVTVRFFAGAQAAAGVPEEPVTVRAPATLSRLTEELVDRHGPALARVLAASSYIVNEVAGNDAQELDEGAHVDILPPFAGG